MAVFLLPLVLFGATFLVNGCRGNVATVVDAVAVTPGYPYILVMFDFHRTLGDDGNCTNINPRAVELLWALRWIDEVLQSNPENKIGLLLHDTCGSERRAIQIVSRYLNPEICMNETNLAGIMSYTTREIRKNITNLVRPFGILHTEISNDQFLTQGSGTVLDLSTISMWKIQAIFSLLNKANWKYVSTVAMDTSDAKAEQKLFRRMADDQNICVADSYILNNASTLFSLKSKVVIAFVTGVNSSNEIASTMKNITDSVFIVVTDSYLNNFSVKNTSNIIFLREELSSKSYITTYVTKMLNKFQESEPITGEYLSFLPFCQKNSSSGYFNCSEEIVDFISERMEGRDLMAILTAFFNLERLLIVADRNNCSHYNFLTCPKSRAFVTLSIYQPSNGFPLNLFELTEGWMVDEAANISVTTFMEKPVLLGNIFKWKFTPHNSTHNESLLQNFFNQLNDEVSCNDRCLECGECSYEEASDDVVAFKHGDLYIGGLFPIHGLSSNGNICGKWSWEAVQLTEAFLYALSTVKDRYQSLDLLPGIALGGVVMNTCGKSGDMKSNLMSMKTCQAKIGNKYVSSKDLIPFIQYDENLEREPFTITSKKEDVMVQMSSNTISLDGFRFSHYMNETAEVLKSLNWTYINIVFSEDVHADKGVQEYLVRFKKSEICVSSVVVLSAGDKKPTDVAKLFHIDHKADVVLVLTNPVDTLIVLEYAKMASSINVVFMAWNVPNSKHELPAGTVVVQPRRNEHSDFNNYLHSINSKSYEFNPWLAKFHEHMHKCHFDVDSNLLYPEDCSSNATSTGLQNSTLASSVIDTVDLLAMSIDDLYKDLCPEKRGLCKAFKETKVASKIKSKLSMMKLIKDEEDIVKFNDEGDLKEILDVVNYQIKFGSTHPVTVGEITNGVLTMKKNSVMTYDVNKIPFVTPHQCHGWCPECVMCSFPRQEADIQYSYTHGDIVLSAILPVHTKGRLPFMCGPLNTQEDMDQVINAFHFAVNTAKTRYPYLLPNVSVGSFVLDSCHDVDAVLKTIMNFETCFTSFTESTGDVSLSPAQVVGYTLYGDTFMTELSSGLLKRLGKPTLIIGDSNSIDNDPDSSHLFQSKPQDMVHAILDFLVAMDWTNIVLVHSGNSSYMKAMTTFMTYGNFYNVCVSSVKRIESTDPTVYVQSAVDAISQSSASTVVVLALSRDIKHFLSGMMASGVSKNLVFGETEKNWEDNKDISLPLGTVVVNKAGKVSTQYNQSYSSNRWSADFKSASEICQQNNNGHCTVTTKTKQTLSNTILSVDVLLHAFHEQYVKLCPFQNGLCQEIAESNIAEIENANVSFNYENKSTIKIPAGDSVLGTFIIQNFQTTGFEEVGRWKDGVSSMHPEKVKIYDINGNLESRPRDTNCVSDCLCLNFDQNNNGSETEVDTKDPYQDFLFYETSGEFDGSIWCVAMLILCTGGALCALIFIVYALAKVCSGLLERRYIGLGVTMLASLILLYMSVLPFLFTPSNMVCTSRRFIPGLAYAFVFATILAKLMALRAYRLIGLGGEISNLNQFLVILFITGVQIAVGVQWLVYQDRYMVVRPDSRLKYACDFNTMEYMEYQVYVMSLILLSALYSLTVRNEKKNLGEARLILVASWIITAVWIVWVVMVNVQSREYVEPSICITMFVCATLILMIVFSPKVYRITNLHYSVKKDGMENGGLGKIDYEFIFERPYTLPASNMSTFKYAERTNPKSISSFDNNFNY